MKKKWNSFQNFIEMENSLKHNCQNASKEEIKEMGGKCPICIEQLDHAKKLPCNHLFHLYPFSKISFQNSFYFFILFLL